MTTQKSFQVSAQKPYDRDTLGGLSHRYSDCIACKLPKETVSSILENIANKTTPPRHESSIYTVSADWIGSLATSIINELSTVLNAPPDHFVEIGKTIANIVSCVGNGTWSTGITPINALKDIETNFPLYISDYFDQLSGWSRENFFEESSSRIGSNIAELSLGGPYPAENPNGLEPALSGKYVKISWKLPNIDLPFNVSNDPTFASDGEQVYRYFAFIDDFKHAISMNEDGSITNELYNFSDPAQLWRIENYGNFYALYNKKYKTYLGRSLKGNNSKPDNNWHESAVYLVEDPETHAYSIGYAQESAKIEYILKDLNLVTVPLVAWRNSSGQFLGIEDIQSGTLGFSDGEQYNNDVIPKSEQLFLFVPHTDFSNKAIVIGHNGKLLEFDPISNKKSFSYNFKSPMRLPFVLFEYIQNIWQRSANHLATRLHNLITEASPSPGSGTRVRVWKADPSVKQIGIRELFLINTDITAGPNDSWFDTVSTLSPITPDENGDFLLTFDNTPPTVPESDNHIRFDVVHTFSVVRYVFNVLSGDLEYLDGRPPVLERPWGNDKRLSIEPHAGEKADAYYSRGEAALRFFYTFEGSDRPIYLCRSIDVVAHEAGHAFLDTLQPDWQADGQTGAFHEAFGDLCSLFVLISMAEIADLFITTTKANLRAPDNFLSAMGEEFGDALYNNKGKGLRNLSNTLKGSKVGTEVHDLSMVFSGFYYDVLADVFTLERNPTIKGDTETLMNVGANLRRALIIAIRVSSHRPTRTKFQEIATNLDIAIGTLGRKLGVDLTSWRQVVKKHAKARELSIAGR